MRQKLFFWVYPPYLITALLFAVAIGAFTVESATDYFFDISSVELRETARMAANALRPSVAAGLSAKNPGTTLQTLCEALAEGTDIRLTLIDPDGRVLADTETSPQKMDVHLDREEVREALLTGSGSASRKSLSTGIETTYEAIALIGGNGRTIAVLRASMPFSIIDSRRTLLILRIFTFIAFLFAIVSIVAIFLTRRLSDPILRIQSGAHSFADGNFDEQIPDKGPLEIANLARALNSMATELDGRIATAREQKNQAEAILNGMSESIAVVDASLTILTCNPAFRALFGNSEKPESNLLALTRNTELCDFVEAAIRVSGPLETGMTYYGDATRQLWLTSRPIDNGKVVLVINDLTRLRHLEQVRRDFTANVSHELKTPITAIKGALETLKEDGFSDPTICAPFLDIATRGTERLEAIISDLLSLARIEEDEKTGITKKLVELDSVIDSVREELSPKIESSPIRVERTGTTGISVVGHEGLLRQALLNLLDNAIKYGSDGGAIEITTEIENGFAILSVTDHGIGIPERDRSRIFERFYRMDKARSRDSGGTGLGLAIVRHIALAHSGSVRLESAEGRGSTFSLLLPLA